ncbi:ubiquitin carboxyl-terminal hydrolase 25-like, partial [Plakobranchus ocellatus]
FMNYGSNNKRYPLPDVLQYALEFAESSPSGRRATALTVATSGGGCASSDVEMKSPALNLR